MAISLASLQRSTALMPPRILLHGVAGVGKTTFAAKAKGAVAHPHRGRARHDRGRPLPAGEDAHRRHRGAGGALRGAARVRHGRRRQRRLARAADLEACRGRERLALDRGAGLRQGLRRGARCLARVPGGAERAPQRPRHDGHPDRAHRHQALRQPRARALRPLHHQAACARRGAPAGALGRRAVRQLPHQHGQGGCRLQQEGDARARQGRAGDPHGRAPGLPREEPLRPARHARRSTGPTFAAAMPHETL